MGTATTTTTEFGTCVNCERVFDTARAFNAHLPCTATEPQPTPTPEVRRVTLNGYDYWIYRIGEDDRYVVNVLSGVFPTIEAATDALKGYVDSHARLKQRVEELEGALRLAVTELLAWSNSDEFFDVHSEGSDYSKALAATQAALGE